MRRLAAILIGLILTLGAQAQGALSFTTSGGLTILVPDGYLVAEIAPLRVGITARDTGASLLFTYDNSDQSPEDLSAAELRRLGISGADVQPAALDVHTANAHIVGARASKASGSVVVAYVEFNDGALGILTIRPADSVPLPVMKSLIESARFAPGATASAYPACGSPELPQTLKTSGGLSVCFPEGFAGEEKGAFSLGMADMTRGAIISIYARADLAALIGVDAADASSAASAFGATLLNSGATVSSDAPEIYALDNGQATAIPVQYPSLGEGRIIAVQTPSDIIVLSAVLIGTPPADMPAILDAVANSASLGSASDGLGTVRPADRIINLGGASFTTVTGWSLISQERGLAALERTAASALMTVAAAPIDASWNAASYKQNVLPAAAQFAGDSAYDPASLETVSQNPGVYTLEVYDSSVTVPDGAGAVNLTVLLTLEGRALVVFQASAARSAYSPAMREEIVQMALSAIPAG